MYRTHVWLVAMLAGIGIVDTAYLSYARLTTNPLTCNILEGCNVVALSPYSTLFGVIPLAYVGFAFYLALMFASVAYLQNGSSLARRTLLAAAFLGFLSSMYFVYLQAEVIRAFCVYCVMSAVLSTAVAALIAHHAYLLRRSGSVALAS